MRKNQKLIYLTDEAMEILKKLSEINGLDNSKVIEILLHKNKKKLKLF